MKLGGCYEEKAIFKITNGTGERSVQRIFTALYNCM